MLKQWLRRRAKAAQTNRKVVLTDSGRIVSPRDCYEQLAADFKDRTSRVVKKYTFFWAGPQDIWRPAQKETFVSVVGIRNSYQFCVLRHGELARAVGGTPCGARPGPPEPRDHISTMVPPSPTHRPHENFLVGAKRATQWCRTDHAPATSAWSSRFRAA